MDLSDKNKSIGHSQTYMSSTKEREALQEREGDLRSVVSANECVKSAGFCSDDEHVELIIEGQSSIAISRQTLRDASPYFATLLKYNENQIRMIPPPNVHLDCFVGVLHYVANNEPLAVDESNVWEYLVLSRYFLMTPLEETCGRVIRQALPTLTMDELCRQWRNALANQCGHVAKWFLARIVRNLDQAGQSVEFLNLCIEEVLALLRDDDFLPIFEQDVYKAIISWCNHNPDERMAQASLDVLLAEIMWDHFDSDTILQLAACTTPRLQSALENLATNAADRKKPKRAVERHLIFGHATFVHRNQLLHYDCLRGTLRVWQAPAARTICTKDSWRYVAHDLSIGQPTVTFLRKSDGPWGGVDVVAVVNLVDGSARAIGNGLNGRYFMDLVMGGYDGVFEWCYQYHKPHGFWGFNSNSGKWEGKSAPFHCKDLEGVTSCFLQLPGVEGKGIAHLLSFFRLDESNKRISDSVIGFCDKHKDFFTDFQLLPALPAPCHGAAIVQCGTFLFVTGGAERTNDNVDLAKQCYRLDLTTRDHWERIGDLSVPRVYHCMFVKSGRVFVYGGSMLNADKKKVTLIALTSFETYDPYADMWTAFNIPLTDGGQGDVGSDSIGDCDQMTYCLDLGSSLDETQYRDIDEPIL